MSFNHISNWYIICEKFAIFTTIYWHTKFGAVENMTDRTNENILRCVGNVLNLYNKKGFKIETILLDP